MKCLILAAGYATRLYPLTENFPKPLLTVGEKTILDWLIEDIDATGEVDEYIVISNGKFARHFDAWAAEKTQKVTVVNDGTMTNETRLGAVMDIKFACEKLSITDDVLIIAGDNLLDFSLADFISYAKAHAASCILRYYEVDEKRLRKSGVVSVCADDRITEMQEKPNEPKSNWCAPPFYYYTSADIALIDKAIADGCGTDAPGSYAAWLAKHSRVYAMQMRGKRYDIGNIESYEQVKRDYRGITVK